MARTRAPDRLDEILEAATWLFMRRGYQATRMEHIAEEAGVSPGTLYLYAEGKEALFDLVLRRAFHDESARDPELPYGLSDRTSVIERSWQLLRERLSLPLLESRPHDRPASDMRAEFQGLVEEAYDWMARYWRGLRVVEKCAVDWPELAAFFYREARRGALERMREYLAVRMAQGALRRMPDAAVAARVILETIAFFAMHRHTAPDSAEIDDATARATVITILINAFVP